jgi:transposase
LFRNRRRTSIKILMYDGQGFWLCHKRLSSGRLRWWPSGAGDSATLRSHELAVLLSGGDPSATRAVPEWHRIDLSA